MNCRLTEKSVGQKHLSGRFSVYFGNLEFIYCSVSYDFFKISKYLGKVVLMLYIENEADKTIRTVAL